MTKIIKCVRCNKDVVIENITPLQFNEIQKGKKHIQDIFPNMKPELREMFISGVCDECWKEIFKDE